MSCNGANFADLKQTWSKQSSLRSNDWDPYPELQHQPNCYVDKPVKYPGVTESYKQSKHSCASSPCSAYATKDSMYPRNANVGPSPSQVEGYTPPCCWSKGYINLEKTWKDQKPYNL